LGGKFSSRGIFFSSGGIFHEGKIYFIDSCYFCIRNFKKQKINTDMTTKLIILLSLGGLVLGGLAWSIVRAWRYRSNHPEETYWPYSGDLKENENGKTAVR
jgi:hypothetical protein